MRYLAIKLKHYTRFKLGAWETITINFTEAIQTIVGSNGAGKSSLMSEISPSPGNPNDFREDGEKVVDIEHNNHLYKCSYFYGKRKTKNSFIMDGIELNVGGTQPTQLELIREHFNYDPRIQSLFIGDEKFTRMPVGKRREWLTRLNDVSFDYALGVYDRLRSRHRDTQGALNRLKERLVNETSKLLSKEEEERLQREITALTNELEFLQSLRAPLNGPTAADYEQSLQASWETLDQLTTALTRVYETISRSERIIPQELTIPKIDGLIKELELDQTTKRGLIQELFAQCEEETAKLEVLQQTGDDGVASLQQKEDVLRQRITDQSKDIMLRTWEQASNALSALETIEPQLMDILVSIPLNKHNEEQGRPFTQATFAALRDDEQQLKEHIQTNKSKIVRGQLELERIDNCAHQDATVCPACKHQWVQGFDANKKAKIEAALVSIHEDIAAQEKQLEAIASKMEEFNLYREHYSHFSQLVKSWPVLAPLWEMITEYERLLDDPRSCVGTVNDTKRDIRVSVMIEECYTELNKLLVLKEQALRLGNASIQELQNRLLVLNTKLTTYTTIVANNQEQISILSTAKRHLQSLEKLQLQLQDTVEGMDTLTRDRVEMIRRETVIECINQLQISIGQKVEAYKQTSQRRYLITDMETELTQLESEELVYRHLCKELSPTEGLIADGMMGFIRRCVREMNHFIGSVWTSPLEIRPCGISTEEGVELDYKFPVKTGSDPNKVPTPDISKSSAGMHDIINLAFVIFAMRCMGMSDHPLMLDEFGKTFDPEHANAAMHVLQDLMESKTFTQMFLISHFHDHANSFPNAEICVLDDRNVVLPEVYNKHVVFS